MDFLCHTSFTSSDIYTRCKCQVLPRYTEICYFVTNRKQIESKFEPFANWCKSIFHGAIRLNRIREENVKDRLNFSVFHRKSHITLSINNEKSVKLAQLNRMSPPARSFAGSLACLLERCAMPNKHQIQFALCHSN